MRPITRGGVSEWHWYEVSLPQRCQDADNFWGVGIRTISECCQGPDSGRQDSLTICAAVAVEAWGLPQCLAVVQRRLHFDGMKMRSRRRHASKMDAACQIASARSQFVGVG